MSRLRSILVVEPGSGENVGRKVLFQEYVKFCKRERIEHTTNSAFGRMINQVFPDLKSRRLGARNKNVTTYMDCRLLIQHSDSGEYEEEKRATQPAASEKRQEYKEDRSEIQEKSPYLSDPEGLVRVPSPEGLEALQPPPIPTEQQLLRVPRFISPLGTKGPSAFFPPAGGSPCLLDHPFWNVNVENQMWTMFPVLASLDLMDNVSQQSPWYQKILAGAIEAFFLEGNTDLILLVDGNIWHHLSQHGDKSDKKWHCLFVLGWWRYFLGNSEGAIPILSTIVRSTNEADVKNAAIKLLNCCTHQDTYSTSSEILGEVVLGLCRGAHAEKLYDSVKRSVGTVLQHTIQNNPSLTNFLGKIVRTPGILALCFHELFRFGLLQQALGILDPTFVAHLMSVLRPFESVHCKLREHWWC